MMKLLRMCRSILVLVFAPPFTILASLLALLLMTVFRFSPVSIQGLTRFWGRTITRACGVSVRVEGLEKLDARKPYIFAANHQSQFDIFALQGHLNFDFRWLAKKELFAIPFFGQAMRKAGYIPVDRSHGRQALKSLNEAARRIAEGTSVIIFPEGTRSLDGRLQTFKAGGMTLAIKSAVDLAPVAIIGTHEILPKGKLLAHAGEVIIRVGAPIPSSAYEPKQKHELAERLRQAVADLMAGNDQKATVQG